MYVIWFTLEFTHFNNHNTFSTNNKRNNNEIKNHNLKNPRYTRHVLMTIHYKQCLMHWMIDTGPIPADCFTV